MYFFKIRRQKVCIGRLKFSEGPLKRANCVAVTWHTSVQTYEPDLSNPVDFGWTLEDKQL